MIPPLPGLRQAFSVLNCAQPEAARQQWPGATTAGDSGYENCATYIRQPASQVQQVREFSSGGLAGVWATRAADSGNLDRIQIVKGWLDEKGAQQEKIYNVTWSGERRLDARGELPAVGNTVDAAKASYSNSIGAAELAAFWEDPGFDPEQHAFYYVRVLEIPTPRWSTYDAARLKVPVPGGLPASIQERAFSSPIWYQPAVSTVAAAR